MLLPLGGFGLARHITYMQHIEQNVMCTYIYIYTHAFMISIEALGLLVGILHDFGILEQHN